MDHWCVRPSVRPSLHFNPSPFCAPFDWFLVDIFPSLSPAPQPIVKVFVEREKRRKFPIYHLVQVPHRHLPTIWRAQWSSIESEEQTPNPMESNTPPGMLF